MQPNLRREIRSYFTAKYDAYLSENRQISCSSLTGASKSTPMKPEVHWYATNLWPITLLTLSTELFLIK